MQLLDSRLDRLVVIEARPATVFSFFTDSERWAQWWGVGSTIDPTPGGRVFIRHPNGVEMAGEVLEIDPPTQLVFTYGYVQGGLIPEGGSRVTIRLDAAGSGTRLHLTHEFADDIPRDEHVQGWRYQLALFANAVANVVNANAPSVIDTWFEAWNEPEADRRQQAFARVAEAEVEFRDQYGFTRGLEDLNGHAAALQKFMPGTRIQRSGAVRHCQGRALSDWLVLGGDGAQRGRGTNVFVFGPEGRISSVTGFWAPPEPRQP